MKEIITISGSTEKTIKVDGTIFAIALQALVGVSTDNVLIQVTRERLNGSNLTLVELQPLTPVLSLASTLMNVMSVTEGGTIRTALLPLANGNFNSNDSDYIKIYLTGLDPLSQYKLFSMSSTNDFSVSYKYSRTDIPVGKYLSEFRPSYSDVAVALHIPSSTGFDVVYPQNTISILQDDVKTYSALNNTLRELDINNDGYVAPRQTTHYIQSLSGVQRMTLKSDGVTPSHYVTLSTN